MTESAQANLSPEILNRLQRLRISILAFQNEIAPLPAGEQSNARNEQFNQLRLEARALLKEQEFDKRAPRAVTEDVLAERGQKVIVPRLSVIVVLGVILALLGFGVNSIFLDDWVVIVGCLTSTGGMLLIIGAFVVLTMTSLGSTRRLTNFGDLYQHCNMLLYEINHALNMAMPDPAERPAEKVPSIPSVMDLALDSLHKQAADWQLKLRMLEEQRLSLDADAPLELGVNIDFVKRELEQVQQELDRLHGRGELADGPPVPVKPVTAA
jgi:hypothetical protein